MTKGLMHGKRGLIMGVANDHSIACLLYTSHLLVLLQASGVSPAAVMDELKRREGTSGLVEKASRPHD